MKASPLPRKTANLSESIHRHLNMYALTASAAGVGALVLAQPAEGKIVYTPANVNIAPNGGLVVLDLNHDGSPDFALSNKDLISSGPFIWLKVVQEQSANEIWGKGLPCYPGRSSLCAAALPKGRKVGPKGQFQQDPQSGLYMAADTHEGSWWGPWLNVKPAYLGLKFKSNGKFHYGWARLSVKVLKDQFKITATLTGYAYETIPNKAIITGATNGPDDAEPTAAFSSHTPEPATLGALALGAPGLSIWRRDEPVAATSDRN
jgi:hypothetical protein